MNAAITAKDLDYSYGDAHVLKSLVFSVGTGSFFIIIGPNGSGKTTLMKLISGILQPGAGYLEILGRSIRNYTRKALARKIAYVPQLAMIDFPLTVAEVVLMGRSPH